MIERWDTTMYKEVQTSVFHVFIDEYPLRPVYAASD